MWSRTQPRRLALTKMKADRQDLHRTATRVLRPSSRTTPLNYGLGSGEPTIVAQGQVEGLGDVAATLKAWGLGRQAY